jgi:hypothetical protein
MAQKSAQLYAHDLIFAICCLTGSTSLLELDSTIAMAIQQHNTPKLFEWLIYAFSFQGIADDIASSYIERHGLPNWAEIKANVEDAPCSKLKSYWTFSNCGYRKLAGTCNEPEQFWLCPLPRHQLRNGRLNQIAYALFLFVQDIADGDLVYWIDRRRRPVRYPILRPALRAVGLAERQSNSSLHRRVISRQEPILFHLMQIKHRKPSFHKIKLDKGVLHELASRSSHLLGNYWNNPNVTFCICSAENGAGVPRGMAGE